MSIKITKAMNIDEALKANEFLTRLILDEKQYDNNINENCIIKSFYEDKFADKNNCLLIAKKEDIIVGYLYGYVVNNGDTYLTKMSKIDAMFVEESNRNLKIATLLIETFKNWSIDKCCQYIEVTVFKSNIAAYNLYKQFEFKDTKSIMSLDLGEY